MGCGNSKTAVAPAVAESPVIVHVDAKEDAKREAAHSPPPDEVVAFDANDANDIAGAGADAGADEPAPAATEEEAVPEMARCESVPTMQVVAADTPKVSPNAPRKTPPPNAEELNWDDWDEDEADDAAEVPMSVVKAPADTGDAAASDTPQRAFGPRDVLIGGEDADIRVCRPLRCTQCDFDVERFANSRWGAGCDYIFVRNYAGVPDELRRELDDAPGTAAYCCQCAWQSVGAQPKLMERFGTPAAPEGGSGNMDTVFWVRKS